MTKAYAQYDKALLAFRITKLAHTQNYNSVNSKNNKKLLLT